MHSRNKKQSGQSKKGPLAVHLTALIFILAGLYGWQVPEQSVSAIASLPSAIEMEEDTDGSDEVFATADVETFDLTLTRASEVSKSSDKSELTRSHVPAASFEEIGSSDQFLSTASLGLSEVLDNTWYAQRVQIEGTYFLEERALLEWVAQEDLDVYSFASGALEARLSAHPWVSDVKIEPGVFPFELMIDIREARPWLVVEFANGESWLLSREGTFLQSLSSLKGADLILHVATLARLRVPFDAHNPSSYSSEHSFRILSAIRMIRYMELAGGFPVDLDRYEISAEGALVFVPKRRDALPLVTARPVSLEEARLVRKRALAVIDDASKRDEVVEAIDLRFRGQAVVTMRSMSS